MNQEILSAIEIDAIGEIINISLGASATAISTMLSSRVEITVPRVRVENYEEFEFKNLEPAIAVAIEYIQGISGNNIMILKKNDVRIILETLMQTEYDPATFELDEIGLSAVCEVMNQMMGASATALSELLGRVVNISTPTTFEVTDVQAFKEQSFQPNESFVAIEFDLAIEGKLKSEFINVMPMPLVKDMVRTFMGDMYPGMLEDAAQAQSAPEPASEPETSGGVLSQEEIERMMAESAAPSEPTPPSSGSGVLSQEEIERMMAASAAPSEPTPPSSGSGVLSQEEIERMMAASAAPSAPAPSSGGGVLSQEEIERMLTGNAQPQPQPVAPQASSSAIQHRTVEPRVFDVKDSASDKSHLTGKPKQENLDMIMDVPLVVSVEIGRTKKPLKEILEITQGSLIVLDKMAGDQVELYANNKCIAKGDVVVVHDNFGIRITEVMGKS